MLEIIESKFGVRFHVESEKSMIASFTSRKDAELFVQAKELVLQGTDYWLRPPTPAADAPIFLNSDGPVMLTDMEKTVLRMFGDPSFDGPFAHHEETHKEIDKEELVAKMREAATKTAFTPPISEDDPARYVRTEIVEVDRLPDPETRTPSSTRIPTYEDNFNLVHANKRILLEKYREDLQTRAYINRSELPANELPSTHPTQSAGHRT